MLNQSFLKSYRVCLYLTAITLTNALKIERIKASVPLEVGLIETSKYSEANIDPSPNEQLKPHIVAQISPPEAIEVIPQNSNIITPEKLNPSEQPEPNPSQSEQKQPTPPNEQVDDPAQRKKLLDIYILNSVSNSAKRYPWFINPTDNLNFSGEKFNPLLDDIYTDFDLRFAQEQPILNKLTVTNFPRKDQFYWVLPDNRIVVETKGLQAGILYQGESTELENRQKLRLSQALWGMQTVTVLPQRLEDLTGEVDLKNFSIQSTAAELITPEGILAPPITIDNQANSNSVKPISDLVVTPKIGTGSTQSSQGGGALFQYLDSDNTPQIIQAFPTNNLQSLLEAKGLFTGAFIPKDVLAKTGFFWENLATGEKSRFQPEMTSLPGTKVAQYDKFDNLDLLNILVNPFLSPQERQADYLNSLFWVSLGQRKPEILENAVTQEKYSWHNLYFSNPHNRTLLQHDSKKVEATYYNVFANPGISLSFSFNKGDIDQLQTANATLGLLMGGIFETIQHPELKQSLQEAKAKYKQQDNLASLNSKSTPEQRKKINQRLNRTLFFSNSTSKIEQVSGKYTFPSPITPNNSSVLQIRTGNIRRTVQFIGTESQWTEGDTYISKIRLSNNNFGSLTFIGLPIPLGKTSIQPINHSSAVEIKLISPDGEQFVQNFNSSDLTTIPMNISVFDMASDRIELTQVAQLKNKFHVFQGSLYLPTIEALWTGSSGNWNYGISSGIWLNLNSASAFNVTNNQTGTQETGLGIYINGLLNLISNHVKVNADGKSQSVTSQVPSLQFHWNSASNSLNPSYMNLIYAFSHQNQKFNYSLTPGLTFIYDNSNLKKIAFIQGNLGLSTGLQIKGSMEFSKNLFYSVEGLTKLNSNWSMGAYFKNFRSTNQGFSNRVADLSCGFILQKNSSNNSNFWQSSFGISGDSFEVQFKGGLRF